MTLDLASIHLLREEGHLYHVPGVSHSLPYSHLQRACPNLCYKETSLQAQGGPCAGNREGPAGAEGLSPTSANNHKSLERALSPSEMLRRRPSKAAVRPPTIDSEIINAFVLNH